MKAIAIPDILTIGNELSKVDFARIGGYLNAIGTTSSALVERSFLSNLSARDAPL